MTFEWRLDVSRCVRVISQDAAFEADFVICQRGPLTFALVTLPITEEGMADWLTSRAAILLEAVESVVESSVPFSTLVCFVFLLKRKSAR